ncbi:MAG: hypothetical protein IT198_00305 [Acidimicrobiia bacterium]|nr:hypothetical protein [Acidimicrobiia bacterium]
MIVKKKVRDRTGLAVFLAVFLFILIEPIACVLLVSGWQSGAWPLVLGGVVSAVLGLLASAFYGRSRVQILEGDDEPIIVVRNGFRECRLRCEDVLAVKPHYFPSGPWGCPRLILAEHTLRIYAYVAFPPSEDAKDLAEVLDLPVSKKWGQVRVEGGKLVDG